MLASVPVRQSLRRYNAFSRAEGLSCVGESSSHCSAVRQSCGRWSWGLNSPSGRVASSRLSTFKQAMELLGWSEGRNLQINVRWGEDDIELGRKLAAELVALSPDVILAGGTVSM